MVRNIADLCRLLGVLSILSLGGCPSVTTPTGTGNAVDTGSGTNGDTTGGSDTSDNSDGSGDTDAGDDLSGEFSGDAQKITAYRDTLTEDEAYHLLRRAAFGAGPADVEQAVEAGLAATVDELLTKKSMPREVKNLAASYENDIAERWMVYLLESPNPLIERMTLFWHDRFAASGRVATDWRERSLPVQHYEMLRSNALGNYRDFLSDLTLDPLMLLWLDGANSPKESPNENYAREFWELFTLGRDVLYTEDDIRESALAFTGTILIYSNDEDPRPAFDLYHHDTSMKLIFPERADAAEHDYSSVIDLTLAQPEAAEYVARNLFAFFVHNEPSDEVVDALAAQFIADDFEIKPLVRTILTSQAMFSETARGTQISSPVEHYIGIARTFDMHIASEDSQGWTFTNLVNLLADAGQELLDPPSVAGWDEGEPWLEDQWLLHRVEALGVTMEYGDDLTTDLPYHLLPPVSRWDEREVRAEIVADIAAAFHLELTEEEEDIYVEVLDQNGYLAFHLADPEQQPRHVAEMIRLMAMHPGVIVR